MAMTFLQLCQRVAQESGTINGNGQPASVVGQSGRLGKVVTWTASAWTDIQTQRDWLWMQGEFTGTLAPGAGRYTGASFGLPRLGKWLGDQPDYLPTSIHDPAVGLSDEHPIRQISYQVWRSAYGRGAQAAGRPTDYAISPAGELCFGPLPDKPYVVRGEYRKSAQRLAGNTDVPELPEDLEMMIVWRGLILLGEHDEAVQNLASAAREYTSLFGLACRTQLPEVTIGAAGSLA